MKIFLNFFSVFLKMFGRIFRSFCGVWVEESSCNWKLAMKKQFMTDKHKINIAPLFFLKIKDLFMQFFLCELTSTINYFLIYIYYIHVMIFICKSSIKVNWKSRYKNYYLKHMQSLKTINNSILFLAKRFCQK